MARDQIAPDFSHLTQVSAELSAAHRSFSDQAIKTSTPITLYPLTLHYFSSKQLSSPDMNVFVAYLRTLEYVSLFR